MASILKVDQIQTAAGGTPTAADLGINTTGTVLQVVSDVRNYSGSVTISATSYTSLGIAINITPKYASSKIIITYDLGMIYNQNMSSSLAVARNNVVINAGPGNAYGHYWWNASSTNFYTPMMLTTVDEPNTTQQVTYDLFGKMWGSGTNAQAPHNSSAVSIIIQEIAG